MFLDSGLDCVVQHVSCVLEAPIGHNIIIVTQVEVAVRGSASSQFRDVRKITAWQVNHECHESRYAKFRLSSNLA